MAIIINKLPIENIIRMAIPILFSIGISIIITTFAILILKKLKIKKERFMVSEDIANIVNLQKDTVSKWITDTEKRMRSTNINMKIKKFIILKFSIMILTFLWSIFYFKNITAALLITLAMFFIPDYIIHIIENKNKQKEEEQLVTAMRIFMAEYMQHFSFEKTFATIYSKIQRPIGTYFGDAYYDLLVSKPVDAVLGTLSAKIEGYYGKMFVYLLYQIKNDSNVINLIPDILMKQEEAIEMSRDNKSSLAGERVLAFIMAISPLPIYFIMKRLVPEIECFVINTMLGRMLITITFLSLLLYMLLDRLIGGVN